MKPLLLMALLAVAGTRAMGAETVEPGEITKRPDLIGREISVDDRVQRFTKHTGGGIEAIVLMRSAVIFRLPTRLAYPLTPGSSAARIVGVLRREGNQWYCDVSDLELFPRDRDRLEAAVTAIPAGDFAQRAKWAEWAKSRGKDFNDKELQERGRLLEAEAIRIEADRPGVDPAVHSLAIARRAREHGIPEPEPSALAHRGFRARLSETKTAEGLQTVLNDLDGFFPNAGKQPVPKPDDEASWIQAYDVNPAAAYRAAPGSVRAHLDRRLWADASQRLMEMRAAADPRIALELSERARSQMPDRPELADKLLELGLATAAERLTALRLAEVEALAKSYAERLRDPERARGLLRAWLDDQRKNHLSPTDAEGRVALAGQYKNLVHDEATAVELLQAAWAIDPGSPAIANEFLSRGFRKVNDQWVEPRGSAVTADQDPPAPGTGQRAAAGVQTIRGKTPKEVRAIMGGPPNQVSLSLSQGAMMEQWIYFGARSVQYVNFLHRTGEVVPTATAYYSLPRTLSLAPQP